VRIDNTGPDTITGTWNIKLYVEEDGGSPELLADEDKEVDVTTAAYQDNIYNLGVATAASYVFTANVSFVNDTNLDNNIGTSSAITVSVPTIIAPAGNG